MINNVLLQFTQKKTAMRLVEVKTKKQAKAFLDVARDLYKKDPYWVCPLDSSVEAVFDPKQNIFFENGEACRWILLDDNAKYLGRVAAFINGNKAYNYEQPTGGMGFFECVEDKDAAFMLFNQCQEWLRERGMEAMDGPINFGENDEFWGLLIEGYMHPGFGMNYNFPYYEQFFEDYGFRTYFDQVTNHLDMTKPFPDRFWKIAKWAMRKPGLEFRHFSWKHVDDCIGYVKEVYDNAWRFHENFTPLDENVIKERIMEAKPIVEEDFIWFAFHDGKPIAFEVMFPDVNQILKHLNGKLHFWNQLRFLYYKKTKTLTRTRITIMGVVPEFQKSGIESALFWHMQKAWDKKPQYNEIELSWVGDFNPKMRALHEAVGGTFAKRHRTYRCLFSNTGSFQRYTTIPVDTKDKAKKSR
jgi:GNAT superfamily N-acetyltransferase